MQPTGNDQETEPNQEPNFEPGPVVQEPPMPTPEVTLRRSSRPNKGQTSKYKDFVLQQFEATATDKPFAEEPSNDSEGEDVTGTTEDDDVKFTVVSQRRSAHAQ